MGKLYDALKGLERVLDNAQQRVIEAKRLERAASDEEQLHEANCAVYRAEREYNDAMRLHKLILNLI
jgi:hypothetical protein